MRGACYAVSGSSSPADRERPMSTVEEITAAIEQLPARDVARIREWLAEFAERLWDEQIERDARSGRLDALIDTALEEHRAGRTRPCESPHDERLLETLRRAPRSGATSR